jgi:hypothetical protein
MAEHFEPGADRSSDSVRPAQSETESLEFWCALNRVALALDICDSLSYSDGFGAHLSKSAYDDLKSAIRRLAVAYNPHLN